MNHLAVAVAHDLDLDVAWMLEVLLDVHRAVAEGGQRLVLGQVEQLDELICAAADSHSLAATARGGLDDDGKADLLGEGHRFVGALDGPGRSRHGWHARLGSQAAGGGLVAH